MKFRRPICTREGLIYCEPNDYADVSLQEWFFFPFFNVLALRASLKSFRFSGKALELGLLQVLPPYTACSNHCGEVSLS